MTSHDLLIHTNHSEMIFTTFYTNPCKVGINNDMLLVTRKTSSSLSQYTICSSGSQCHNYVNLKFVLFLVLVNVCIDFVLHMHVPFTDFLSSVSGREKFRGETSYVANSAQKESILLCYVHFDINSIQAKNREKILMISVQT